MTTCDACGLPVPEDEVIQFEGRQICAACKPAFVQQLREGVLQPLPEALPEGFEERTLGMGELVKVSWRVVRADWMAIAGLVLLVGVPINLLISIFDPSSEEVTLREIGRSFRFQQSLEMFVGVLASLGIARIVSERLQGRKAGFVDGLLHGLRRWLPGVGTGIVEYFILLIMILLLVVPGIIWTGYYVFSIAVVSLRGCAGKGALDYSKALVKGRWWGVVGRILGLTGLSFIPMILIEIGLAFAPTSDALSFISMLLTDVCFAFASVGTTVLFLNLDAVHQNDPALDAWRPRR
jgi:hypothetical protein